MAVSVAARTSTVNMFAEPEGLLVVWRRCDRVVYSRKHKWLDFGRKDFLETLTVLGDGTKGRCQLIPLRRKCMWVGVDVQKVKCNEIGMFIDNWSACFWSRRDRPLTEIPWFSANGWHTLLYSSCIVPCILHFNVFQLRPCHTSINSIVYRLPCQTNAAEV